MVSIRRRRLLGLCSGRNSFLAPFPRFSEGGNANPIQNINLVSVDPMPLFDAEPKIEVTVSKVSEESSHGSGSSSSKDQPSQHFPVVEVKRRKRYRRKHLENQEPCLMRGVYFKNMKWQAAIKVDKKQIHLGTVGSQEEAAHLYDRAAFMCGREPNSELSEEEKKDLGKLNWDEFLVLTRSAITSKKHKRSGLGGLRRKPSSSSFQNSDMESDQQEDGEVETSLS
ncbi:ethylene-responsive transcription factor-like protein At4g13040 [Impatiens glandulifera]|uniref:ethylene-responsive transcription factor-like protein At4g13040 n=1 Tax=Impatiens glandulifera TaxID=253017 RepID=UPI001FB08191|nr:ethylene-responsive transcription factor-like protein At4g13040 [Impatiens glandulifera]